MPPKTMMSFILWPISHSKVGNRKKVQIQINFVCESGKVYELDGLQPAPRLLEKKDKKGDPPLPKQAKIDPQQQQESSVEASSKAGSDGSDWIEIACERMQEKISSAKDGEIRFNLMCLCQDQRVKLKGELAELNKKVEVLEKALTGEEAVNASDGRLFKFFILYFLNYFLNLNYAFQNVGFVINQIFNY